MTAPGPLQCRVVPTITKTRCVDGVPCEQGLEGQVGVCQVEKGEVFPACGSTLGNSGESFEVQTINVATVIGIWWKEAPSVQLRHHNFPLEETMANFFNVIDFEIFHSV